MIYLGDIQGRAFLGNSEASTRFENAFFFSGTFFETALELQGSLSLVTSNFYHAVCFCPKKGSLKANTQVTDRWATGSVAIHLFQSGSGFVQFAVHLTDASFGT